MAAPSAPGLKRFYALLAGIAVAGVIALVLVLRGKPVSIPANVVVQTADTAGFRGYLLGQPTAPVEVTEYGDFQCPACASFDVTQFPTVKERLIAGGVVRWRYRDFPLSQHRHSRLAAHAAACADEQGKYWEMHRLIYESQLDWAEQSDGGATSFFRDLVKTIGGDPARYDACMQSAKYAGRIQASYDEGTKVGLGSTPTFLIGGRLYPGAIYYDDLKKVVDSLAAAAPKPQPGTAPAAK